MKTLLIALGFLSFASCASSNASNEIREPAQANIGSFKALDLNCTYQVMAAFSEKTQKYDIDLKDSIAISSGQSKLVDVVGNNSMKKYKILFQNRKTTDGTSLNFSVYENFKGNTSSFTGKSLSTGIGLFSEKQSKIQLQTLGQDIMTNIICDQI